MIKEQQKIINKIIRKSKHFVILFCGRGAATVDGGDDDDRRIRFRPRVAAAGCVKKNFKKISNKKLLRNAYGSCKKKKVKKFIYN